MVNNDVFAVIAEPTRREILTLLSQGDLSVGELVEVLGTSQPTVSKHLKVLREAGLVTMRAEGQRRFYSIDYALLRETRRWFDNLGAPATILQVPPGAKVQGAPEGPSEIRAGQDGTGQDAESVPQQISRSVGRAATRAADLLANLPKFGRRKDQTPSP